MKRMTAKEKIAKYLNQSPMLYILMVVLFVILRVYVSLLVKKFDHLDEIFQTLEFASFRVNGYMGFSQEVLLHLRNMTLANLLAPFLWIGSQIFESSYWANTLPKLFVMSLDLLAIYFLYQIAKFQRFSQQALSIFLVLFFANYAMTLESSRISLEHISLLFFIYGLYCLYKITEGKHYGFLAGFFLIMVGAFRYPSLLLSGTVIVLLPLFFKKKIELRQYFSRENSWFYVGTLLGLLIGGMGDFFTYGRWWESSINYLQYNVFTSSASTFGEFPGTIYFYYFTRKFFIDNRVLGFVLVPLLICGLLKGFKEKQLWVWPILVFILGHLIPAHKEPRFISAIIHLLLFVAAYGFDFVKDKIVKFTFHKTVFFLILTVIIINNFFLIAKEIKSSFNSTETQFPLKLGTFTVKENDCAFLNDGWVFVHQFPKKFFNQKKGYGTVNFNKQEITWTNFPHRCFETGEINYLYLMSAQNEPFLESTELCSRMPFLSNPIMQGFVYRCQDRLFQNFDHKISNYFLVDRISYLQELPLSRYNALELKDFYKKNTSADLWSIQDNLTGALTLKMRAWLKQ